MENKHHALFAPSQLDALVKCPFYHSGPAGEAAQKGTDQHIYIEALFSGDETAVEQAAKKLDAADRENCQWYYDLVKAQASGELEIEQSLELLDKNFQPITFGTIDAAAGPEIWDYKSDREERDHKYQMAAYALMRIRQKGLERCTAHICYGKFHRVVSLTFTEAEAWDMIENVLALYYNPDKTKMPNDFCSWCVNAATCTALTKHVACVMGHIAPENSDKIIVWEPSEISDPSTLGRALNVARIVSAWCASIEKHAKLMMEAGHKMPGWTMTERAGARQVTDITKAFALSGLPEASFLKACSVKIGELEEIYAQEKGIKKAAAKREVNSLLADVIEQKKPIQILTREKGE